MKNILGQRLRELREEKELNQRDIANVLGITYNAYGNYERGTRSPDPDTIRQLAEFFGVSTDYLLGKDDLPLDTIPVGKRIYLPIVGTVKAGPCGIAFQEILGQEWVEEHEINGAEYFWLKVKGDSMINAGIFPGDLALIRCQPIVEDGEIAVAIVDGEEGTLKRVRISDGVIMLESANVNYPTRIFPGKESEKVRIVGRLKQIKRNF